MNGSGRSGPCKMPPDAGNQAASRGGAVGERRPRRAQARPAGDGGGPARPYKKGYKKGSAASAALPCRKRGVMDFTKGLFVREYRPWPLCGVRRYYAFSAGEEGELPSDWAMWARIRSISISRATGLCPPSGMMMSA